MSGQYHVELRPRSLRYYTIESRHKTLRNVLLKCAAQNEMTALGQKQTSRQVRVMSALAPKADICSALTYVRFVPIADIGQSIRSPRRRGRAM